MGKKIQEDSLDISSNDEVGHSEDEESFESGNESGEYEHSEVSN